MPRSMLDLRRFLLSIHPYDSLPDADLQRVLTQFIRVPMAQGDVIYTFGEPCEGLYIILDGEVEITTESGEIVSHLGSRNSFGERGLMRDGTYRVPLEFLPTDFVNSEFAQLRQQWYATCFPVCYE